MNENKYYIKKQVVEIKATCKFCGKEFSKMSNQRTLYCNKSCQQKAYYAVTRKKNKPKADLWSNVSQTCKENNLSYGQAVAQGLI